MKTIGKLVVCLIVISVIVSCSPQTTPTPESTPSAVVLAPGNTAYPVSGNSTESSTYPVPVQEGTEVPPYLVPGYITMTPDAELNSVIVSEVRHEDGEESIYITNISSVDQDISNYMIYSPALDVRKILPSNLILEPGESFIMFNGANLDSHPADQQWLDTPILIEALDEVWLTNSAARILYYFIYYPSITP